MSVRPNLEDKRVRSKGLDPTTALPGPVTSGPSGDFYYSKFCLFRVAGKEETVSTGRTGVFYR